MIFSRRYRFPAKHSKVVEYLNKTTEELFSLRVPSVSPATDPITPKTVWMLDNYSQLTLHRIADFYDFSCRSWGKKYPAVAFLLTRAIMENAAVIYDLAHTLEGLVKKGELNEIHAAIHLRIMGGRNEELPSKMPNVLTAIDRVNKQYDRFRELYDNLSEFAHPNYSGMHGLYGNVDRGKIIFHIDRRKGVNDITLSFLLAPLSVSMLVLKNSLRSLVVFRPAIWFISDLETQKQSGAT